MGCSWRIANNTLGPANSWRAILFDQRICMLKSPWTLRDKVTLCLHSAWFLASKGVIDWSCHIQVIYIFQMIWNHIAKVQILLL
jgi:hypothetical protein